MVVSLSSEVAGRCTVIWCLDLLLAEDEGPKQDLSQKLCCFGQEGGRLSGADNGAASEALWLSPVPETTGLCISHCHPCSLPSAESWSQGGSRQGLRQKPLGPGGPLCSHQEGGRLSGAEDGAGSEALWFSPVPERAGLCIPHPHPCSLPSVESRSQGGSRRGLRQKPLEPGRPLCSHQEEVAAYDNLNRLTSNKLGAVVVGIDYRLAPQYQFPAALEDCVHVIKFFLQDKVLAKYRVDPSRICIMGDSSGGTLAATVTQLLRNDPEFKNRIKAQALLYPGLQMIDTFLPSHREYGHGPILHREMMLRVASLYVTKDSSLTQALLRNEHMPEGSRHLFKFVNWSDFLPEKYKKNHVYTEPVLGKLNASYPALMDSRLFPLLVNDSQLQNLPLTYIFTCEHDLLRDDSFIYITRLRNVGVRVIHEHMEEGVHGAISFTTGTLALHLGFKIRDRYIHWLEENL